MKKLCFLFTFLMILSSCSSDDNTVAPVEGEDVQVKSKLVVSATATDVTVGEVVEFTAKDKSGAVVEDAKFIVNSSSITAKHVFDKAGQYAVSAIHKDFTGSNEVVINVGKATLELRLSESEVTEGKAVTFQVFKGEQELSSGVKIYEVGNDTALEQMTYVAKTPGQVSFVAKGEGFIDSNLVSLTVLEDKTPYQDTLVLSGDAFEIDAVSFDFDVKQVNGKNVGTVKKTTDGTYANQYTLIIRNKANDKAGRSFIFVDIWVINPTIKVNSDGEVTDYGKRVLPTNDNTIVRSVYSSIKGYEVTDTFNKLHESELKIRKFEVKELDAKGRADGETELMFNYESLDGAFKLEFKYNGEMYVKDYKN